MNKCHAHGNHSYSEKCAAMLSVVLCLATAFPVAAAPDARKIMEGVYLQDTSRDMTMRVVLDIYGKDGQGKKKQFVLSRLGSEGDSKTLIRFTSPEDIRGVALLSINSKGVTDRQWLYTPAIDRVRSISPRERSEKFEGSDFTYEDVGERVLDDFTYQLIGEGEIMDNHKTFKIKATPVTPDASQYKYIYFWVAQDIPIILAAEMYDQSGQKIRVMHGSQIKRASGIWGVRRVEMATPAENTRATLTIEEVHFNTGLDEKMFTPEGLASFGKDNQGKTPKAAH
jgi:outer membrane lipoprotein-sorting protein